MVESSFMDDEILEAEKLNREQKSKTEQFLADIIKTFGSDHGKRVFTFLLEQGMVSSPLYAEKMKMERNVAIHDFVIENVLGPVLMADEEIYLSIIRERARKAKEEEEKNAGTGK